MPALQGALTQSQLSPPTLSASLGKVKSWTCWRRWFISAWKECQNQQYKRFLSSHSYLVPEDRAVTYCNASNYELPELTDSWIIMVGNPYSGLLMGRFQGSLIKLIGRRPNSLWTKKHGPWRPSDSSFVLFSSLPIFVSSDLIRPNMSWSVFSPLPYPLTYNLFLSVLHVKRLTKAFREDEYCNRDIE